MFIHERIREIRQALGLSQAKLICAQYNVNEAWLRDGTGEMFRSASDHRLERIIALFLQLEPDFQDYVLEQTDRLLALQNRSAREPNT